VDKGLLFLTFSPSPKYLGNSGPVSTTKGSEPTELTPPGQNRHTEMPSEFSFSAWHFGDQIVPQLSKLMVLWVYRCYSCPSITACFQASLSVHLQVEVKAAEGTKSNLLVPHWRNPRGQDMEILHTVWLLHSFTPSVLYMRCAKSQHSMKKQGQDSMLGGQHLSSIVCKSLKN